MQEAERRETAQAAADHESVRLELARLRDESERCLQDYDARVAELGVEKLAKQQAEASVATLKHDLRHAQSCVEKLEAELAEARGVRERLEAELKEAQQARQNLQAEAARMAQERERAASRLAALPAALQILQTRMTDTLLRPLEEALRVELAPPPAGSLIGAARVPQAQEPSHDA